MHHRIHPSILSPSCWCHDMFLPIMFPLIITDSFLAPINENYERKFLVNAFEVLSNITWCGNTDRREGISDLNLGEVLDKSGWNNVYLVIIFAENAWTVLRLKQNFKTEAKFLQLQSYVTFLEQGTKLLSNVHLNFFGSGISRLHGQGRTLLGRSGRKMYYGPGPQLKLIWVSLTSRQNQIKSGLRKQRKKIHLNLCYFNAF